MEIKQFKPINHKIKALVYGSSGSGKTVFGGTAKNAIFASAENGLLSIADKAPDFVAITNMEDLRELLYYLKNEEHKYDTIIIDSITEINEMIKIAIEKKTGKAMQIQDWGELGKKIRGILNGFKELDMHVLFIAQESTEKDDEKIQKITPLLNGKSATEIAYRMDIVGYLYVNKEGERQMITSSSEKLLTKDRTGLIGNDTEIDFSVWIENMKSLETGEQQIKDTYEIPEKDKKSNPKSAQIYTIASKIKAFEKDFDVKGRMLELYGKDSTKELNTGETNELINKLKDRLKILEKKDNPKEINDNKEKLDIEKSTSEQCETIKELRNELKDDFDLHTHLKSTFKVEGTENLTKNQADKVISTMIETVNTLKKDDDTTPSKDNKEDVPF